MKRTWLRWVPGALAIALALAAGCGRKSVQPLQVAPETYRQMVSAFYTGTVALQVGDLQRAGTQLRKATEIVPEEPAAWANLALTEVRLSNWSAAAQSLEKAVSLAPPDSRLELMAGLIASGQGRPQEGVPRLRKAIQLDPNNLRARAALIEELNRQAGPDTDREVKAQVEAILKTQPENLWAQMELARIAAKENDLAALRERLGVLKQLSAGWPPVPKQHLAELEKTVTSADARAAIPRIAILVNVLKPTPAWQQSRAALGGERPSAEPFERFVRLPTPPATPAAPDEGLTFAAEPARLPRSIWARAAVLTPAPPPEVDVKPKADGPVAFLLGVENASGFQLLGALPGSAPFSIARGLGSLDPRGALLVDWNNDYRPDLALAGRSGLRLLEQQSPTRWLDVTAKVGLPPDVLKKTYTGAWAIDLDLDGDLDLVLGTASGPPTCLQNNGDGTCSVIQAFQEQDGLLDLVWADLDGDGDPDVATIDGAGKLVLWENQRLGFYRRWPAPLEAGAILALAVSDADRNGDLDVTALLADGSIRRIAYRDADTLSPGDQGGRAEASSPSLAFDADEIARWDNLSAEARTGEHRLHWADLDNNGSLDLVASGPSGTRIWLANGEGKLNPLASQVEAVVFSVVDFNGDGRLDLAGLSTDGSPVRLLNRGSKSYSWVVVRPRSEPNIRSDSSGNSKINSFALGGEAELRAGLLAQKQPILGPSLHFGLGEYPSADYVRLLWPNGQPQGEFALKAEQTLLAKQRLTGSCPFLFAHDGSGMRFVTDILWKSPLGLRINAQDTAGVSQTRDWVKVRGDQLAARNGFYDLSITAELWETNFFDYVSLMVVDHPEGTEVFVDERFSIPQPPLEILATGPVQPVVRAVDHRGADVTDLVRERDGRHLDTFSLGRFQGVAQEHWVELELPPGGGAARRYLVGYGWVYPTDSSINVALSQGQHAPPRGLSLEVPDEKGGWVTWREGLGFPAGKNKTVLIELPELRRVRLRTNLEIYWDALGVAVALPETSLKRREIAPTTAELRYRGFSEIKQERRSSPELPDYNSLVGTGQQWLDLVGFYTRFGDVRELLARVDDRYVIMNAGDEIVLRFPALPLPPAGWTRDFVFVSDGWDKDGNFNTVFSKTVLPLPSHDQPEYNRPPGRLEDDPVYRRHARDWETYHTRYVTPRAFRRALWPQ